MTSKTAALSLALLLAACGAGEDIAQNHPETETHGEGVVTLTPQQIDIAAIELTHPTIGGSGSGGAIALPATIEGDPQGTRVVSAAIGGRVVTTAPRPPARARSHASGRS